MEPEYSPHNGLILGLHGLFQKNGHWIQRKQDEANETGGVRKSTIPTLGIIA
jgi:hypothetical protein